MFLIYLFFFIFNDFCQTNFLNIYLTDLHQIFRVSRTTAVDELSEVSFFRSFKGRCRGNHFLLVLSASIHRIGFAPEVVGGVVAEVTKGRKRYLTIVLQHNEVTNIQSVQSLGRKPDSAEDHPVTKHGQSWLYTCKLRFNSDLRKRMSIGATEGHSVIAGM